MNAVYHCRIETIRRFCVAVLLYDIVRDTHSHSRSTSHRRQRKHRDPYCCLLIRGSSIVSTLDIGERVLILGCRDSGERRKIAQCIDSMCALCCEMRRFADCANR